MKIKVWDRPTRVFHWSLVVAVVGAFITSQMTAVLRWHLYFGEVALGLVIFRIGYGFVGSYFSRFYTFVKSPKEILTYTKALSRLKPPKMVGHNPLGSLVFGLLLLVTGVLGCTGLLALGGLEKMGLLASRLSVKTGAEMMSVHSYAAWTLLSLIGLHIVGAVTDSVLHRENLILSMFTGVKRTPPNFSRPPKKLLKVSNLAKGYTALCVLLTLGFTVLWPQDFEAKETKAALSKVHPKGFKLFKEECGDCHFVLPPNALPARSWKKMMTQLEDHFGDDASLDAEETQIIGAYLERHAAESSQTSWAYYLTVDLKPSETPQRITELAYWKDRHEDIDEKQFKQKEINNKINCEACHHYAEYGSFENAHIKIPDPTPEGSGRALP